MEHKFLINLTVRYDIDDEDLTKIVSILEQLGYDDLDEKEARAAAIALCEKDILDMPEQDIVEDMKKDGYGDDF